MRTVPISGLLPPISIPPGVSAGLRAAPKPNFSQYARYCCSQIIDIRLAQESILIPSNVYFPSGDLVSSACIAIIIFDAFSDSIRARRLHSRVLVQFPGGPPFPCTPSPFSFRLPHFTPPPIVLREPLPRCPLPHPPFRILRLGLLR